MVDRAIYVDMIGAKSSMKEMEILANNLANADKVGFRADYETIKASNLGGNARQTRNNPYEERTYSDFRPGAISSTGRDLDVAINGKGFFAVQTKEGKEAYTRAGALEINPEGFLVTQRGDLVLGPGGVISIPPANRISIDKTGQIAVQLIGENEKDVMVVNSLKLVEAPVNKLQKGIDGLFYLGEGEHASVSSEVTLSPQSLEGSNVDTVKSMVDLINLSRQFEIHTKLMKSVEENANRSNDMLDMS